MPLIWSFLFVFLEHVNWEESNLAGNQLCYNYNNHKAHICWYFFVEISLFLDLYILPFLKGGSTGGKPKQPQSLPLSGLFCRDQSVTWPIYFALFKRWFNCLQTQTTTKLTSVETFLSRSVCYLTYIFCPF